MSAVVKSWIVDRLAAGLYQGIRGPAFWIARMIHSLWQGFKAS